MQPAGGRATKGTRGEWAVCPACMCMQGRDMTHPPAHVEGAPRGGSSALARTGAPSHFPWALRVKARSAHGQRRRHAAQVSCALGRVLEDGRELHTMVEDVRSPGQSRGAASAHIERRRRPSTSSLREGHFLDRSGRFSLGFPGLAKCPIFLDFGTFLGGFGSKLVFWR